MHTSNYAIQGFTAAVRRSELAELAHDTACRSMVDLGSGTLVDLAQFGLPKEPTPQESLRNGADLVTFSGDKLLGGPQAGIIVGRSELIAQDQEEPAEARAARGQDDLAALEAVLRLYRDPERLPQRLPTLRLLTRPLAEIEARRQRVAARAAARARRQGDAVASSPATARSAAARCRSICCPALRSPSTPLAKGKAKALR